MFALSMKKPSVCYLTLKKKHDTLPYSISHQKTVTEFGKAPQFMGRQHPRILQRGGSRWEPIWLLNIFGKDIFFFVNKSKSENMISWTDVKSVAIFEVSFQGVKKRGSYCLPMIFSQDNQNFARLVSMMGLKKFSFDNLRVKIHCYYCNPCNF